MIEKWFVHADFNHFFCQCEIFKNPNLRGRPVAVCGLKEDRHGIAMAKSPEAKAAGVKTGMSIYQAQTLCPDLIVVPPDLDYYKAVSRRAQDIYYRYSPLIEPFGLDECFVDISGSLRSFGGNPHRLARRIMRELYEEIGLTASIGVAFTKKLAKLGSDISGISEIYYITPENIQKTVWGIKTRELVYIGASTERKLRCMGIRTLGDLAKANPEIIRMALGVNGMKHWLTVNGMDTARVCEKGYTPPVKSVSRGVTCKEDLYSSDEADKIVLYLAQEVARKLRKNGLKAREIVVYLSYIVDGIHGGKGYKCKLDYATNSFKIIHMRVMQMVRAFYSWWQPVRKMNVYATNLVHTLESEQISIFDEMRDRVKLDKAETAFFTIRERYGEDAICTASQLMKNKLPTSGEYQKMTLPKYMFH